MAQLELLIARVRYAMRSGNEPTDEAEIARRAEARRLDAEAEQLEGSLIDFVEAAWSSVDVSRYQPNWALDALCEHLQAVTEGQLSRLLVNFPPRCAKTLITSVCWPAWTWARRVRNYRSGPGVRFLCGSYSHGLSLQNSNLTRRLILSPWYQARWGHRFSFRQDQNTKAQFDLDVGGSRLATSIGGTLLGVGGDIIVVDDPHNTDSVESEAEREHVLRWWGEISTTRLNDPKQAATVVIMQRLNKEDVSGKILSSSEEWEHLMIPMQYEARRHSVTSLGWQDPRGLDEAGEPLVVIAEDGARIPRDAEAAAILDEREGDLMWPDRFGPNEVASIKAGLGPYMSSGRLQQSPQPRSGGIFQRDWWQLWEGENNIFPAFDLVIASLDGAFTEKEENDPSALTIWGVFKHPELKKTRIMLIDAWRKHLKFSAPPIERLHKTTVIDGQVWHADAVAPGMDPKLAEHRNAMFRRRAGKQWGLIEWVADTCRTRRVERLLIEGAASGISAATELRNRFPNERWSVQVMPVKGDKVARALAVQAIFSQGLVYAPNLSWAELTIDEMSIFPKGRYDDLTDSAVQALRYLRDGGLAKTDEEVAMLR